VTQIRGGESESDLNELNDDRTIIYSINEGKLYFAVNFDKERERGQPTTDVYKKAE
jgi:hypothetical protein